MNIRLIPLTCDDREQFIGYVEEILREKGKLP